ncbi:MAG: hypothetical protein K6G81_09255 [Lachnospiraceae bacterium]|nr:hypothetical protein [Lachnospiraceae bacterium]
MQITQKHIQYILLILIVAIGFCAYQFGYVKYMEKAKAIKAEADGIQARINELNEKESHREEWTAVVEQSDNEIRKILAKYGSGNTPEKSIMFIRKLEDAAEMTIPNLSFNSDSSIFVSSDADEEGNPKVTMNTTSLGIAFSTTYDGLKKCMDYINTYYERMNVANFTANYNQESGQISGNMIINLYSVQDADHKYEEPTVAGIDLGTENIFGTFSPQTVPGEYDE